MTRATWIFAVAILPVAAVVVVWPTSRGLARLHGRKSGDSRDLTAVRTRIAALADNNPRRLASLTVAGAATVGLLIGGPVAAVVLVVYSTLAIRAVMRRAQGRRAAAALASLLDDLCGLAADLRAGLPPAASSQFATAAVGADVVQRAVGTEVPTERAHQTWADGTDLSAGASGRRGDGDGRRVARRDESARITDLTAAVWRLAERTGAPAADLVERIEADARAADRARASAAAEAAGAQMTGILLAALPFGGIALGYSIGAEPLDVLLHSPIGAGCAIGAVLLQSAGLLWSDRLMSGATR
jgi:tight adherence protein B